MELQLKHLGPYLAYELSFKNKFNDYELTINCLSEEQVFNFAHSGFYFIDVKPLLRPLSDLTKEIEVNGEKFVPIEELYYLIYGHSHDLLVSDRNGIISCENCIDKLTFWKEYIFFKTDGMAPDGESEWNQPFNQNLCMQKLYEWHFDIYDLIEAGLAIDTNTLNQK